MMLPAEVRRIVHHRDIECPYVALQPAECQTRTDARRNNGSPYHEPDCTCPFCRTARYPRHLDVRLSDDDYAALGFAARFSGRSMADIVREAVREKLTRGQLPS